MRSDRQWINKEKRTLLIVAAMRLGAYCWLLACHDSKKASFLVKLPIALIHWLYSAWVVAENVNSFVLVVVACQVESKQLISDRDVGCGCFIICFLTHLKERVLRLRDLECKWSLAELAEKEESKNRNVIRWWQFSMHVQMRLKVPIRN